MNPESEVRRSDLTLFLNSRWSWVPAFAGMTPS
jgi:hypothetical protein